MENFLEHFKEQIEKTPVCNGQYLKDYSEKTKRAKINEMVQARSGTRDPETLLPIKRKELIQEMEQLLNRKMEEWKTHAGDRRLFYIIEAPGHLEVMKIWESELKDLAQQEFVYLRSTQDFTPIFRKLT